MKVVAIFTFAACKTHPTKSLENDDYQTHHHQNQSRLVTRKKMREISGEQ
jgi:hypothetical protein